MLLALPVLGLALALPAPRRSGEPRIRDLAPGTPISTDFLVQAEELPVFRVRVPARATALAVATHGATYDVELYASFGEPPDPYAGEWDVAGSGIWVDEELLIDVTDAYPLEPGDWYFAVALSEYVVERDPSARVAFEIAAELLEVPRTELAPGLVQELVLERRHGLRVALAPALPSSASGGPWRVEVFSPRANVDVLIGPAASARPHRLPWASSESVLSYERLALEDAWLSSGALLHVFAMPEAESIDAIPVRVLLSQAAAPLALVPAPLLPDARAALAAQPFRAAVAATVSIVGPLGGGSGVVISSDGLVVTSAHVVAGAFEVESGDVLACGFTLDAREAPIPAFRLSIVDSRRELDLALLRIEGTLDGGPLPTGLRFPVVPMASAAAEPDARTELALGEPLYGVGFPMTGGSGSLVTVTITRGILSGFAREREGLLFKTDAGIHSGISGGAVLDGAGELVGIPCSSISDANLAGGLGFVVPIDLLPEEWRVLGRASND